MSNQQQHHKFIHLIQNLKKIIKDNNNKKFILIDETVNSNIIIYYLLLDIKDVIASTEEKLFNHENLLVFEEICNGTSIIINYSIQKVLKSIYYEIIIKSSGYIIRNVLNSFLVICNNTNTNNLKSPLNIVKNTCIQIISLIMLYKSNDVSNQINDILVVINKMLKISDNFLKISCFETILSIVTGCL
jgi:hypothetical protein